MTKKPSKPKKLTLEEKRRLLIHHLLDNEWVANVNYIDDRNRLYTGEETFELDALIMGKFKNEFHLISPDGSYTLKITRNSANFWKMKPSWKKLGSFRIGQIDFIDGGIKIFDILYIMLPKQEEVQA